MSKSVLENQHLFFYCPGCKSNHCVPVSGPNAWGFNGDVNYPTLTPSVRLRIFNPDEKTICHFFIEYGKIRFLNDCQHDHAGRTVELQECSMN